MYNWKNQEVGSVQNSHAIPVRLASTEVTHRWDFIVEALLQEPGLYIIGIEYNGDGLMSAHEPFRYLNLRI
jgi:hypothetical protein